MTGPAVQARPGAGVALSNRLALDLGYRYHRDLFEIDVEAFGQELKFDAYDSHHALLALRCTTGGGAAPGGMPVPMPAPAPAVRREVVSPPPVIRPAEPSFCAINTYVVYFEWDRADLTRSAQDTICTAVDRERQCGEERVRVAGHADRCGAQSYNVVLSNRRAERVRHELVAQDIEARQISTLALGENEPAKPAADGVREQMNRRAESVIFLN
jgi:OmpA-OmpF porin, OOP family